MYIIPCKLAARRAVHTHTHTHTHTHKNLFDASEEMQFNSLPKLLCLHTSSSIFSELHGNAAVQVPQSKLAIANFLGIYQGVSAKAAEDRKHTTDSGELWGLETRGMH